VSATRPSKTNRGYGIISKLRENMQAGEFEEFGDKVDRGGVVVVECSKGGWGTGLGGYADVVRRA